VECTGNAENQGPLVVRSQRLKPSYEGV
jgi:hypothetical protein